MGKITSIVFLFLFTISFHSQMIHAHSHGEDHIEKSYTYDPFFIDVLSNHMKEENVFYDLAVTKSKNKKLINLIKTEKSYNMTSLAKMNQWRQSMYKDVERVVPEKYDVSPLKKANGADFDKKMMEKLKSLADKGETIAQNGEEENFETPIKAFSTEALKRYKIRKATFSHHK